MKIILIRAALSNIITSSQFIINKCIHLLYQTLVSHNAHSHNTMDLILGSCVRLKPGLLNGDNSLYFLIKPE